ncbi:Acrylyl-CoA reductase AcuI, partial [Frankliniella fusca]
ATVKAEAAAFKILVRRIPLTAFARAWRGGAGRGGPHTQQREATGSFRLPTPRGAAPGEAGRPQHCSVKRLPRAAAGGKSSNALGIQMYANVARFQMSEFIGSLEGVQIKFRSRVDERIKIRTLAGM